MILKLASRVAVFLVASTGFAAAATVENTFSFTTPSISNQTSATFTGSQGLDVDVTGTSYNTATPAAIQVENNFFGLVSNNPSGYTDKNKTFEHSLDSYGIDEAFLFDFGREVTLSEIVFGWFKKAEKNANFSKGGKFRLFVDGIDMGRYKANKPLASDLTGTVFMVGAASFKQNGTKFDSYLKLASMTVSYDNVATVPLPAGGLLLLAGLGGLGALRRRRRA
jgi:hypothetical protein